MTSLEEAFNTLTILLCQRLAGIIESERVLEKQIAALQRDLAERPTREELATSQQRELRLGDEVRVLQRSRTCSTCRRRRGR